MFSVLMMVLFVLGCFLFYRGRWYFVIDKTDPMKKDFEPFILLGAGAFIIFGIGIALSLFGQI